jgi:hypothetical protein
MATLRHPIAASFSLEPLSDLAARAALRPLGRRLGGQAGLAASVEIF